MLLGVVGMDKGGGCNGAYLVVKEQGAIEKADSFWYH